MRKDLKFNANREYKPEIELWKSWIHLHQPPGASQPQKQATNVMPDLANAMKYNPNLKVLLNAGYFDLATPFYEGIYEMHHLPIPPEIARQHRIQVLRIRAHGVRARRCAKDAARQRGGLHPRERAAQDQVSGAPGTVAHSIVL